MQDSELLVQTHLYLSTVKYHNYYLQSSCCHCIVCGVQIVGRKLMEKHTKKNVTTSPHVVFALCQPCHLICSLQTECSEQVSFGELDYNSRCPR